MKIRFDINGKDGGTITNVSMWAKIVDKSGGYGDLDIGTSSPGIWYKHLYGEKVIRYYIDTTLLSEVTTPNNLTLISNYLPTAIRMHREQVLDELI